MSAALKRTERPVLPFDNIVERMARVLVEHDARNDTDAIMALLGKWPARIIADLLDAALLEAGKMREAANV